jgi:hyperosmotically inducible periplasmic protein
MRNWRAVLAAAAMAVVFTAGMPFSLAAQTEPDNTGVNKRDRDNATPTADDQKETPADRDLAKEIRKAITDDKSLSSYAHNVKVIAQNGSVTLRGPVRTDAEKSAVEAKAATFAGAGNIKSEITVAPESK